MFENKYIQHLENENKWLQERVEELTEKLFKAVRLDIIAAEKQKPMRYDPAAKEFVEMTPEQIYEETKGLQDLLAQNI